MSFHFSLDAVRRPKYRVVREITRPGFFEAQYKVWWWPFWLQCSDFRGGWGINTHRSAEEAERCCKSHAVRRLQTRRHKGDPRVVSKLGRLSGDSYE